MAASAMTPVDAVARVAAEHWRRFWPGCDAGGVAADILARLHSATVAWKLSEVTIRSGGLVCLVCSAVRCGQDVVVKLSPRVAGGERLARRVTRWPGGPQAVHSSGAGHTIRRAISKTANRHRDMSMRDSDWNLMLARIRDGFCTPFLGAGAGAHTHPLGGDIAARWASTHGYPLEDDRDLARVAQFLAVHQDDAMYPKELLCNELRAASAGVATADVDPHAILATLPLAVFITTNYDSSMFEALAAAGKDPRREVCRWNRSPALSAEPSPFADPGYSPTPASPLVYHLHGRLDLPESLVLTEDDYLDFLVAVARDPGMLPHHVQRALAGSSLLFVGYRLADWDFRVIHRGLVAASEASLRRLSLTVQLTTDAAAREYLDRYFGALKLRVYWGSAAEFARELSERWSARASAG